jgi:hypothetical protein
MCTSRAAAAAIPVSLAVALGSIPVAAQSPPPALLAVPVLVRYEDPAGDTVNGLGADIIAVTVRGQDQESVSISVEFAVEPPLTYDLEEGWTDMLMILGDAGPEGVVGTPPEGVDADFVIGIHGANLQETVEEGAPLTSQACGRGICAGAVAVDVDGATVTLTVTRKDLGDPERILFLMWSFREGSDEQTSGGDAFPDQAGGEWGPYTHAAYTFPTA